MKVLVVLLALSGSLYCAVAFAQAPKPTTTEQIIVNTQNAFRRAKTPAEREGIKLWCTDSIVALSKPEQIRLKKQALQIMETNNLNEANNLLKQANSLQDLAETLAVTVCRPQ
jgi:hypothetical protein